MEKISVVVPVYNCASYVQRCIDSLLNQKNVEVEIIIVNDGSKDSLEDVLLKYSNNSNIKIINQHNQGLYKARTNGLQYVTSDIVTFCDGDDYIDSDFYFKVLDYMKINKCDIVEYGYRKIRNGIEIWDFIPGYDVLSGMDMLKAMMNTRRVAHSNCNKIYKTVLFNNIKFDEPIRCHDEDVLISMKIISKAQKVCAFKKVGYNYDTREGSIVERSRGMEGVDIIQSDRIIYDYVCNEIQDDELNRSVAYDFAAKMAYWYNKSLLCGEKDGAKEILSDFRALVKKEKLNRYFPKGASKKRLIMIHSLCRIPILCRALYILAIKKEMKK